MTAPFAPADRIGIPAQASSVTLTAWQHDQWWRGLVHAQNPTVKIVWEDDLSRVVQRLREHGFALEPFLRQDTDYGSRWTAHAHRIDRRNRPCPTPLSAPTDR